MAVWLVRAGSRGERQDFALDNNMAVVGWDEMPDLSPLDTRDAMAAACQEAYPGAKPRTVRNWVNQFWAFSKRMAIGDLVALPLKGQDAIAFGRVRGDYCHRPDNPNGAKHTRPVEWITQDTPRERFAQDILYSLGAFLTVCRIERNNAEERITAVLEGRDSESPPTSGETDDGEGITDSLAPPDLEDIARTQIYQYISQEFPGHRLADLVAAVLQAQGYQTQVSPPGPDGGVDITAGRGPMGFDPPRLCVQVKATGQQQDVRVLRELKGVMRDFGADQGLFVSWSGFRRSVVSETRRQFFEIRLWDAADLVQAIQRSYNELPDSVKADLPLTRVWTLVQTDT